ncbi:MAG: hypothetical protein JJE21_05680 [Spirochaetaceae bacterium]|nr:hypothetical protein [Spirochaetaceae bacterium]
MNKAVRNIIGSTLLLASLISCTTTKVVSPIVNVVPLQSIAKEGDTLVVVDATKEKALVSKLVGNTVADRAQRISVELTPKNDEYPLTSFDVNAVVEGDFPSFITRIGLANLSGGKMIHTEAYNYYPYNGAQVGLINNNMVGFSTDSFSSLTTKVISKESSIDKSIILKLYDANIGLYSEKPVTLLELDLGLTKEMLTHIDSLLILINEDKDCVTTLNATFDLDTNLSADLLSKMFKIGYISYLKTEKIKPDYKVLKVMFTQEGDIVNISEMPMSDKKLKGLTDSITNNNLGL